MTTDGTISYRSFVLIGERVARGQPPWVPGGFWDGTVGSLVWLAGVPSEETIYEDELSYKSLHQAALRRRKMPGKPKHPPLTGTYIYDEKSCNHLSI